MLEPNIKNVKRLWRDVFVIELFLQNSYFELICQWFERMYLCGFVSFCVRISVEGTMS